MVQINGEKFSTRILSGESAERVYIITGTTSDAEARVALLTEAPAAIVSGTKTLKIDIDACDVEEQSDGLWEGTAVYGSGGGGAKEILDIGQLTVSYQFSAQQTNYKQSLETKSIVTKLPNQIDFNKSINVTQDGVQGVEVEVPVLSATISKKIATSAITDSYIGQIYNTVGTTNESYFRGLQAGEGLMTGVSGADNGDGTWDFDYNYAISPNETNLVIAQGLTIPQKAGWDYLWVYYAVEDTPQGPVQKPVQAQVEKIYRSKNWGALNI